MASFLFAALYFAEFGFLFAVLVFIYSPCRNLGGAIAATFAASVGIRLLLEHLGY